MNDTALAWDLLLRGAVGGLLLFHLVHLALPAPRGGTRAALAVFTLSLLTYLVCQRADLVFSLPRWLALPTLALCTSGTGWLWLAARSLFDDRFAVRPRLLAGPLGLLVLGTVAHLPALDAGTAGLALPRATTLTGLHAAAMLAFTAAALWEVARGWRDDLVEPRRVLRRWVALGIGLYAAVALVVELALRGRAVGVLLPALHVAGIGAVALGLALLVARRSLASILGHPRPAAATRAPAAAEPPPAKPPSAALASLTRAMADEQAYRREGLTLAALAQHLGLGEASLRALINQELGYRNFNDFLHHYRLQEAAGRLAAEELPILTIALDVGYGSIGPFNRAFRQRFGMTPSEYRAAARLQRHQQGV